MKTQKKSFPTQFKRLLFLVDYNVYINYVCGFRRISGVHNMSSPRWSLHSLTYFINMIYYNVLMPNVTIYIYIYVLSALHLSSYVSYYIS